MTLPVRKLAATVIAALLIPASVSPLTSASAWAGTTNQTVTTTSSGPTSWAALNSAIRRIPHYVASIVHWHVQDAGSWGATNLNTGDIYIAPRAPVGYLFSIVVHEYGHALAGHLYHGKAGAQAAADKYFGQRGEYGLEVEADCMALEQGATWTYYTSCNSKSWRSGAHALLAWKALPGSHL